MPPAIGCFSPGDLNADSVVGAWVGSVSGTVDSVASVDSTGTPSSGGGGVTSATVGSSVRADPQPPRQATAMTTDPTRRRLPTGAECCTGTTVGPGMPEPLVLDRGVYLQLVAHCYDGLPHEACGLLAADPASGQVVRGYPTENEAASARVYTVPSKALLHADRDAEAAGLVMAGVFHSHTHTSPYPSPTDVAQAPDPSWHYVIVGLGEGEPVVRSYRIVDGSVEEEPVVVRECLAGGGVSIPEQSSRL